MLPNCNGLAVRTHEDGQFTNSLLTAQSHKEVRASGKGMMQLRKTGSTIFCLWPCTADHAGMPVMMPRQSDSDMCRDGASTATVHSNRAVDEHGKMHSVSDPKPFVPPRITGSKRRRYPAKEEKSYMEQPMESCTQIKGQGKRRAIYRQLCG